MISFTRSTATEQLLGNQLGLGGLNALSELAFPVCAVTAAVGGDADPGIEQRESTDDRCAAPPRP
jgi:hypothetical protein